MRQNLAHNRIIHILLIVILCFLAYSNTFHVPFYFDDEPNIVGNPVIRGLSFYAQPAKAKDFLNAPEYYGFKNRFIGYLTFALNYKMHGLDVAGYHIFNIAIHIISALLVYYFIVLSFRTPFFYQSPLRDSARIIGLFGALLFGTHPIQTQAVTYIVQRFTSLAAMFCLLSIVMYIKWRIREQGAGNRGQGTGIRDQVTGVREQGTGNRSPRLDSEGQRSAEGKKGFNITSGIWYLFSVFSAVLAMKTKEIAFTLPVIIFLYEFVFFEGNVRRRILYLIPLLLTMLIIPLSLRGMGVSIGHLMSDVSDVSKGQAIISRHDYLLTEFRVITTYIRLILFPVNQNLDYDYPVYNSFNPEIILSFLFLLSLFGFGVYFLFLSRQGSPLRLVSFGMLWFFITLSVESSIIPIADVIFEHRVYLPSIGAFIAIATLIFTAVEKIKKKWKQMERAALFIPVMIILVLTGASYARNAVWSDDFRLWEDVVRKSPGNARGITNLGRAYADKTSDYMKAIGLYKRAITVNPNYYLPYYNIGVVYAKIGQYDIAIEYYSKAITLNPASSASYHNRGGAYVSRGQIDKAIEDFNREIAIDPGSAIGYSDRGFVYFNMDRYDLAVDDFTKAIALEPSDARTYMRRGFAYASMGKPDSAVPDFKKACAMGNVISCGALKLQLR